MFFVFDWFLQFLVLFRKNIWINIRNWKTSLFVILSPVLIVIGLNLMSVTLIRNIENVLGGSRVENPHPKPYAIPRLPTCTGFGGRKCVTLRFSPHSALPLIQTLLSDNRLSATDYVSYDNGTVLSEFILNNPNTTMVGLSFDASDSPDLMTGDVSYTILYNDTESRNDPLNVNRPVNYIPSIQTSVDNAIVKTRLNKLWSQSLNGYPTIKSYLNERYRAALNGDVDNDFGARIIDISLRSLATPKFLNNTSHSLLDMGAFEGFLMYVVGGFFLQFSIVMFWIALLYYIVWEKSVNLRFAMTIMGMRNSSWWHSWFMTGLVQMFCAVLAVYLTGLAFKMRIFVNTNPVIFLIIFGSFGVSLISVAMLLSVITTSNRAALLVAFIVNGVAFFTTMITSNGIIIYAIYSNLPSVAHGLSWFPPYHFCKCIADLITVTYGLGGSTDLHFSWKIFTHEMNGIIGKAPPTLHNVLYMWAISAVVLLVAWYLDHILPTSMNGKTKPFYFFVLPSFWGLTRKRTNMVHITNTLSKAKPVALQLQAQETDKRVAEQITKALEQQENEDESDVLRIVQVEKTYGGLFGKKVKAVQNVSFKANKGTCLALLGHNGAGKSTIISTIVGQNDLSAGHCFVFGQDVSTDMDRIRKNIGVCFQDDFLNPNMTAWEHLQLFAQFKDIPNKKQEIEQRLHDVGLYNVRNNQTRTYSGGMKRRLSCAIALIGSPSMVILDEPTTGLDVQSKRLIWNLVHQMKKDKLVLLTTHTMEEADKLGDQIVIMAYGKIKCFGNSLQLKDQFGAGFNVQVTANIVQNPDMNAESEQYQEFMHQQLVTKMTHIQNVIRQHVPQAEEVSQQANSLLYKLPQVGMKELIPLVQDIESISISKQGETNAIIKSFHLSHSTLEEVYLSVTKQANFGVSSDRPA